MSLMVFGIDLIPFFPAIDSDSFNGRKWASWKYCGCSVIPYCGLSPHFRPCSGIFFCGVLWSVDEDKFLVAHKSLICLSQRHVLFSDIWEPICSFNEHSNVLVLSLGTTWMHELISVFTSSFFQFFIPIRLINVFRSWTVLHFHWYTFTIVSIQRILVFLQLIDPLSFPLTVICGVGNVFSTWLSALLAIPTLFERKSGNMLHLFKGIVPCTVSVPIGFVAHLFQGVGVAD